MGDLSLVMISAFLEGIGHGDSPTFALQVLGLSFAIGSVFLGRAQYL